MKRDMWEQQKKIFYKNRCHNTMSEINKYLSSNFNIQMERIEIAPKDMKVGGRWRYKISEELKRLKFFNNIVYINFYTDKQSSYPFICGVTGTGKSEPDQVACLDFNFDLEANKGAMSDLYSGRAFTREENFDYDRTIIQVFSCETKEEALLLERIIKSRFNLFSS